MSLLKHIYHFFTCQDTSGRQRVRDQLRRKIRPSDARGCREFWRHRQADMAFRVFYHRAGHRKHRTFQLPKKNYRGTGGGWEIHFVSWCWYAVAQCGLLEPPFPMISLLSFRTQESSRNVQNEISNRGLFRLGLGISIWYCSIFICIWQLLSNHDLTRLKRFVS